MEELSKEEELTKEKIIDAPLAEVWKAWTTAEGARTFFAPDAHIVLSPGGPYELYFMPEAPEGSRGSEGCTVVEFGESDDRSTLAVTWNFPPTLPAIRNEHTRVTLTLQPVDPRRTRVRVSHTGWKEGPDWKRGYTYFDRAWTLVLERLQHRFTHGPLDWKAPYTPEGF